MATVFSQIGNIVGTAIDNLTTMVGNVSTTLTNLTTESQTLADKNLSNVTTISNMPTSVKDDLIATIEAGATDLNVKPDSWHIYRSASLNHGTTDKTIDFNVNTFIGTNVSEGGGRITVNRAGMYIISCTVTRYASDDQTLDFSFRRNGSIINGTRMYVSGNNIGNYDSQSAVIAYPFNAGDIIDVWGRGYMYGSSTESMTFFSGTRIGDI